VLTTYAHIDLASLVHNLIQIQRYLAGKAGVLAVVKANAYGHGAVETAETLVRHGVSTLGVVSVPEGIVLREAGVAADIVVLGTAFEEQLADAFRHRLTLVVSDQTRLAACARAAAGAQRPIPIHLKIETGMGRLGFSADEVPALLDSLKTHPLLKVEGVMTHLADADGKTSDYTEQQLARFREALDLFEAHRHRPLLIHAANSAAIVRYPGAHFSLVRPGIMLYGYHTLPISVSAPLLKPVMTLRTTIAHVRTVKSDTSISYNRTFVSSRPSRIAVLPIGYADGYSRRLSNRGAVLIHGKRAPIAGTICMDMTMVDVTGIPETRIGDEVVLIGSQGQETIGADEIAEWSGTIPYEVLCGIGPRVQRIYSS
jgi:alanine racemase